MDDVRDPAEGPSSTNSNIEITDLSLEEPGPVEKNTNRLIKDISGFLLHLAAVAAAVWAVFTFVFGVSIAHGETMYPRIRDGDVLFYYRMQREIRVGDVLCVKAEGQTQIGRVVAVGGETVDISPEGQFLVNGNVVSEEIFYPTYLVSGTNVTYPYTVPENDLFLLSDFRTNGYDSRNYGSVNWEQVNGKVITVLRRRGI